jgi:hypothetical protein
MLFLPTEPMYWTCYAKMSRVIVQTISMCSHWTGRSSFAVCLFQRYVCTPWSDNSRVERDVGRFSPPYDYIICADVVGFALSFLRMECSDNSAVGIQGRPVSASDRNLEGSVKRQNDHLSRLQRAL